MCICFPNVIFACVVWGKNRYFAQAAPNNMGVGSYEAITFGFPFVKVNFMVVCFLWGIYFDWYCCFRVTLFFLEVGAFVIFVAYANYYCGDRYRNGGYDWNFG